MVQSHWFQFNCFSDICDGVLFVTFNCTKVVESEHWKIEEEKTIFFLAKYMETTNSNIMNIDRCCVCIVFCILCNVDNVALGISRTQ